MYVNISTWMLWDIVLHFQHLGEQDQGVELIPLLNPLKVILTVF